MMRTSAVMLLTLALVALLSAPAGAEPPPGRPPHGMFGPLGMMGPPAFLEQVFPPELVMRYQSELGLTPAQQDAMMRIMTEAQAKLVELQWKFAAVGQALTKLLEKDTVDEEAALTQWDQLSGIEQQIKKTHLSLLLRIKNQLTPSQQEQLRALRPSRPGPPFQRGAEARPGPPFPHGPED
jgi:Spy/CpxP family protein refolding chaperone